MARDLQSWSSRSGAPAAEPTQQDAEPELLARVAQGDQTAWTAVVERHLSAIVATAWHVLGDRHEAEDVAQETFVRLMAKARDWRAEGPPLRAWLHRVAVNLAIDRKRARRTVPFDDSYPEIEAPEGDVARRSEITRAVGRVLDRLPRRQRAAVALVHFQGFSGQEAADMLGVSVEALESLLARARRALRTALRPTIDDLLTEHR